MSVTWASTTMARPLVSKAVADKAAKEYGSKAAGERVAGAQFQKMKKAGQLKKAHWMQLKRLARKLPAVLTN
jgi:hypothetical protein